MAALGGLATGVYRRSTSRNSDLPALTRTAGSASFFDRDVLAKAVESDIIPRLLLLHRDEGCAGPPVPPGPAEIAGFARMLLAEEYGAAAHYVSVIQASGASIETVFLQLFAPAARLLGDLWKEDMASFAEVAIGLSRLQQIMGSLRHAFEEQGEVSWNGRRVLLAPAPGEQHSFGLSLVDSFLRRSGWHVEALWGAQEAEILRAARTDAFDLIGFSLSCDSLLDRLSAMIRAVRRVSSNRSVKILVGGSAFTIYPERVALVGADASAQDAAGAAAQAGRLAIPLTAAGW